jgi:hypothetical protein
MFCVFFARAQTFGQNFRKVRLEIIFALDIHIASTKVSQNSFYFTDSFHVKFNISFTFVRSSDFSSSVWE